MAVFRRWLTVFLTAAMVALASAQTSVPSCATKLIGCQNYLNATTTPPASCCGPLKQAVLKERPCLCGIYSNPALLKLLSINVTQIMGLPKLCSIDVGKDPTDLCKGIAQAPGSPSTSSTPAAPGGTGSGSGGSNGGATVEKFAGTGLLASLLVYSVYAVYY